MAESEDKARKKEAKARSKAAKADAKSRGEIARAETDARIEEARIASQRVGGLPEGVGVTVRKADGASELVVSGLKERQLSRILPEINREVLIAVTEERSAFLAALMRFVREGVVQTVIKIIAGLVVGYLLIRFGLR